MGALLAFATMLVLGGCATMGYWISGKVYPHLEPAYDNEPPVTPTAVLPSLQLTGVLGGRGGGISCSIPGPIKPLFFLREGDEADVNLRFRQACAYHDLCYRHGHATYGYTQAYCDFALQESAYRLCRNIYAQTGVAPPAAMDGCREQARTVLLGVRLGGGQAFQAGGASTYFEFDPMPARANDFGVVRWLEDRAATGPLAGRFVQLNFEYGRVQETDVQSRARRRLAFEPSHIPTPPVILSDGDRDFLVSLAREDDWNTGYVLYHFDATRGPPPAATENAVDTFPHVAVGDPEATVAWPRIDSTGVRIHSLQHGVPRIAVDTSTCDARDCPRRKDRYRYLVQAPLAGRFSGPACPGYAAFRRAGDGSESNSGEGFERDLRVAILRDPGAPADAACPSTATFVALDASEGIEPLSVIDAPDGTSHLVGLDDSKECEPFSAVFLDPIHAGDPGAVASTGSRRYFADPESGNPITEEWARIPASILRPRSDAPARIVFARFRTGAGACTKGRNTASGKPTGAAFFDVLAYDYEPDPKECDSNGPASGRVGCRLHPSSGLTCRIDIARQARIEQLFPLASAPRDRPCAGDCPLQVQIARVSGDCARLIGTKRDADNAASMQACRDPVWPALSRSFTERWANGAVIPGHFRVDEPAQGPELDVAFFFRGYTQYAFLGRTRATGSDTMREEGRRIRAIASPGEDPDSFATCTSYPYPAEATPGAPLPPP